MDKKTIGGGSPWWMVALPTFASFALIAFGFWTVTQNAFLRNQLDNARMQIAQQSTQVEHARRMIETMQARDTQKITLVAAQTKPQPQAQALYRRSDGQLVLFASNMAPLPQRKTYQLWILPADGSASIPSGTFTPDAKGNAVLVLPQIPAGVEAKAFAVTVEPEGGSQTPTMPILMLGTTS